MKRVRELLEEHPGKVVSVVPEQSILSVAQLMRAKNVGTVAVVRKDALIGVLSERDMLNKVLAPGLDPRDVFVSQIMSRKLATATPEDTWEEAVRKMRTAHCRHLPVLENGRLIAILSLRDLLGVDETELLDRYLWDRTYREKVEEYSQPELKEFRFDDVKMYFTR